MRERSNCSEQKRLILIPTLKVVLGTYRIVCIVPTYNPQPQPQPQPTPNLKRPDNGSRRPPPSDAISMISMAIGSRLPNRRRGIACGHSGPLVYLIGGLKVNYNLFNFINIYCRVISGVARHRQSPNEIIVASRTIARGRSMPKPTKNIGSHQHNLQPMRQRTAGDKPPYVRT